MAAVSEGLCHMSIFHACRRSAHPRGIASNGPKDSGPLHTAARLLGFSASRLLFWTHFKDFVACDQKDAETHKMQVCDSPFRPAASIF
jgi:hypothetical protein